MKIKFLIILPLILSLGILLGYWMQVLANPMTLPNPGHPASQIGGDTDPERTFYSNAKYIFQNDLQISGKLYTDMIQGLNSNLDFTLMPPTASKTVQVGYGGTPRNFAVWGDTNLYGNLNVNKDSITHSVPLCERFSVSSTSTTMGVANVSADLCYDGCTFILYGTQTDAHIATGIIRQDKSTGKWRSLFLVSTNAGQNVVHTGTNGDSGQTTIADADTNWCELKDDFVYTDASLNIHTESSSALFTLYAHPSTTCNIEICSVPV
jgi:hypothetical protein